MSKKFLIPASVTIFFSILFMVSCDKKVAKLETPATAVVPPPAGFCDTISYNKHIGPIMQTKCALGTGCHGSGAPRTNLTSYASAKGIGEGGSLKARVIDGSPSFMPQGSQLPQNEKDLIQCWINNGFKEQ
ncbi:MAG: hypothetical protein K0S32_3113 [Bacteroidetes bacterium]|jgi:hypothetical protein|nr:hypothetical protein [Bacteroidota bacterium]